MTQGHKGEGHNQEQRTGLDIIGDVHGYASKLEERLHSLGYEDSTGVYRHPDRTAVFVGDLVDRGPEQLRVLQIVKAMVDDGGAHIVMGNHEFNAIAYANGLREHNEKNHRQHRAFLEQLTEDEQTYYIDWFWTLPLWLDLGAVRVVHACWHEPSMKVLGGDRLAGLEQLVAATTKGDPVYEAVETLLKGPEIGLAEPYLDKELHPRRNARIKWWYRGATTLRQIAVLDGTFTNAAGDPYPQLPDDEVGELERSYVYNDTVPLFYGHYWRTDEPVEHDDWTTYTACVDFSAGNGGTLVAYRWNGEPTIAVRNYRPHYAD